MKNEALSFKALAAGWQWDFDEKHSALFHECLRVSQAWNGNRDNVEGLALVLEQLAFRGAQTAQERPGEEINSIESADEFKADVKRILGYFELFKGRYFLIVDHQGKALSNIDSVDPWNAGKENEILVIRHIKEFTELIKDKDKLAALLNRLRTETVTTV